MSKCTGCGISLQNVDKLEIGYTNDLKNKYCERCFRLIHYNEDKKVSNLNNENVINKINQLNKFTFFITDIININEELIKFFKSIHNEKVLVINKCDIIPNNLKLEHLEKNIKEVYNIYEDVFFISAKNKMYLSRIINLIEDKGEVIFCGETSSGKSTLINSLTDKSLTTSKYNNTTLDFIKIKYFDYIIYDTPGILFENEKRPVENIIINTKKTKSDYEININDTIISGDGNLTIIFDKNVKWKSNKLKNDLNYNYVVKDNSDILINGVGFIYIKKGFNLKSNKKLEIRKSIIGR